VRKSKSKKIGMLFLTLATIVGLPFSFSSSSRALASTTGDTSNGASVQAWLTDVPSNTWIARQDDVAFTPKKADQPLTISIDENRKYQSVLGFGAALTDSSGWLIGNKMSDSQRSDLMKSLFSPKNGIGLNLVRLPMGATDLSASGDYSYDDLGTGVTDPTLSHFSIQHDLSYIIPELKQALSLNPSTQIMANPWSPPGWMKTTDSMEGGTLKTEDYTVLANYFAKFIKDYKAAGVPVAYISPQNEPQYTGGYPGMNLSASQESQLIQDIGEAFKENAISTQILSWDHNWDMPAYPEQIYSDPTSSQYTPATAWHCYGGDITAQSAVHNDYPGKGALITECSGGTWQGDNQSAFKDELDNLIINGMRNWSQGLMLWNLALDTNHGPTNNGCLTCNGLVTIDQNTGKFTHNTDYYALGQASKFVQVGAHRIYSNSFGAGSIEDVAFKNPDGSKVIIAYNSGDNEKTFSVADGTRSFNYALKAGDAVTFKWAGPPQNGNHSPAATNVQDQTHDFSFKSTNSDEPITVVYDPALMTNSNTFLSDNKLISYTLPYGASIQNTQKETALDRTDWKVTASSSSGGDVISNTIDGNQSTRWSSGHGQTSGDWVQINLGSLKNFNKISLDTGPNNQGDYVRQYQVFVSNDGVKWENAIVNGTGNGETLDITLPNQTAQYIRVVSTGSSGSWWSIGEINVYAPQDGTNAASISGPVTVPSSLQMKSWESSTNTKVTVVYNGSDHVQSFPISTDNAVTYTLPAGAATLFTTTNTSDLQTPAVTKLSSDSGIAGQTITIEGSNFGNGQGLGTVYFGSTPATITNWTDTSISVMVPRGLDAGNIPVSVYGSNGLSAGNVTFNLVNPTPFDRTWWTATASDVSPYGDVPGNMLDGDLNTRYSSGKGMYNGGWIKVDMGKQQTFNALVLDSGPSTGDYSRSADLYVSTDGTNWTKVTSVVGNGPLVSFIFPEQTARYIKVVNTGDSGSWWSIAELNVYNE
jgi:O-glycosyl hydrolase